MRPVACLPPGPVMMSGSGLQPRPMSVALLRPWSVLISVAAVTTKGQEDRLHRVGPAHSQRQHQGEQPMNLSRADPVNWRTGCLENERMRDVDPPPHLLYGSMDQGIDSPLPTHISVVDGRAVPVDMSLTHQQQHTAGQYLHLTWATHQSRPSWYSCR